MNINTMFWGHACRRRILFFRIDNCKHRTHDSDIIFPFLLLFLTQQLPWEMLSTNPFKGTHIMLMIQCNTLCVLVWHNVCSTDYTVRGTPIGILFGKTILLSQQSWGMPFTVINFKYIYWVFLQEFQTQMFQLKSTCLFTDLHSACWKHSSDSRAKVFSMMDVKGCNSYSALI